MGKRGIPLGSVIKMLALAGDLDAGALQLRIVAQGRGEPFLDMKLALEAKESGKVLVASRHWPNSSRPSPNCRPISMSGRWCRSCVTRSLRST